MHIAFSIGPSATTPRSPAPAAPPGSSARARSSGPAPRPRRRASSMEPLDRTSPGTAVRLEVPVPGAVGVRHFASTQFVHALAQAPHVVPQGAGVVEHRCRGRGCRRRIKATGFQVPRGHEDRVGVGAQALVVQAGHDRVGLEGVQETREARHGVDAATRATTTSRSMSLVGAGLGACHRIRLSSAIRVTCSLEWWSPQAASIAKAGGTRGSRRSRLWPRLFIASVEDGVEYPTRWQRTRPPSRSRRSGSSSTQLRLHQRTAAAELAAALRRVGGVRQCRPRGSRARRGPGGRPRGSPTVRDRV